MEPRDIVTAWVEAFNRGDAEALANFYAPDAVNHQVAEAPVEGRDAIRAMFAAEFARADMRCIVENIFQDGEWAILEWRDPLGLRGCGFFHVQDGKIVFQRGYWDKLSFLRQQGLPVPLEEETDAAPRDRERTLRAGRNRPMSDKKFDPARLDILNDPRRLLDIPPDVILSRLETRKGGVVVEIGAGTAFFSRVFLELFDPSALYACDLSETMIAWMKDHVVPSHPGIIPVNNEEDSVPLPSGVADLVFMIVLHHELEHPLRLLREARRVLKSDGEIFIVDWKPEAMSEGPPVSIRCRPEDVASQLLRSGFDHVAIHDDLAKHFLVVGKAAAPA